MTLTDLDAIKKTYSDKVIQLANELKSANSFEQLANIGHSLSKIVTVLEFTEVYYQNRSDKK